MTIRLVPSQYPTIAAAAAASNPGDVIQLASDYTVENATIGVDHLTVTGNAGNASTGKILLTLTTGVSELTLGGNTVINVNTSDTATTVNGNDATGLFFTPGNTFNGGTGNDTLNGGGGINVLNGGGGNDT